MYKIIRELILFVLLSYLSIWISIVIIYNLDLRSSDTLVTKIEEVFLIQLSLIIWFLILIVLYFFRILIFLIPKKDSSEP